MSRPANPFPYFTEVMTGFEYTAAVGMLYEGQIEEGLRCIRDVRDRYDGRKRSPFDEAECGHHYARAMAAWAAVLALTGFRYSAVEKRMTFAAKDGSFFWSNGYAWGSYRVRGGELAFTVQRGGSIGRIVLSGLGDHAARARSAGRDGVIGRSLRTPPPKTHHCAGLTPRTAAIGSGQTSASLVGQSEAGAARLCRAAAHPCCTELRITATSRLSCLTEWMRSERHAFPQSRRHANGEDAYPLEHAPTLTRLGGRRYNAWRRANSSAG